MKEVSGSLKLELAQYREVEAFSTFGSELDETTQHTINRGLRLIEVLKQQQYVPLPVEYQIVYVYVGMQGFLDGLSVNQIGKFKTFILKALTEKLSEKTPKELIDVNINLDTDFLNSLVSKLLRDFKKNS